MGLPVLHIKGNAYEQGLAHGRALRAQIRHNLSVYFHRFEKEVLLPRAEVLERASQFLHAVARQNADYGEGMRGIAEGAGVELQAVAALNARYEILYYQFGYNAMASADGCTAFAVMPEACANGHLLMGQNWDWIPQVQGAVLHATEPSGLQVISFTEAGIFGGKIGLNSAGVGLAINGLTTTQDNWSRMSKPFHVRCYEILRSTQFEKAVQIVTGEGRSCSTNFLIAQAPDKAVDIEAAPNSVRLLHGPCLVHANHFLDPGALGVQEPPSDRRPCSYHRHARMSQLMQRAKGISMKDLKDFLRDHDGHPGSVCRHEDPQDPPQEHYRTVTSVIMDLTTCQLEITDGPPCGSDYELVRLRS